MNEQGEWKGGRDDSRLYRQVREEKQRTLATHYERIRAFLDERGRRLWAANEAIHAGGWVSVATSAGLRQMRADIALSIVDAVTLSGDRIVAKRTISPQQLYHV